MMEQMSQDSKILNLARERFISLLKSTASEGAFQNLFAECPYILSRALPLKLHPHEIIPLGRSGLSEPDFIFYHREEQSISSYGVIELKRPNSSIITMPRKGVVSLTRNAATAIAQARLYAKYLPQRLLLRPEEILFLGSRLHIFVIMGLSIELTRKIISDLLGWQATDILPEGCQIIPYDELLRRFESTLPRALHVLIPASSIVITAESLAGIGSCLNYAAQRADIDFITGSNWSSVVDMCVHLGIASLEELRLRLKISEPEAEAFCNVLNYEGASAKITESDIVLFFLVGLHPSAFTIEQLILDHGWSKGAAELALMASKELIAYEDRLSHRL
jgi:hypothetical protein